MEIPDWLEVLITCCCFVDNFDIQSTAISTMLDLISLTQYVKFYLYLTELPRITVVILQFRVALWIIESLLTTPLSTYKVNVCVLPGQWLTSRSTRRAEQIVNGRNLGGL